MALCQCQLKGRDDGEWESAGNSSEGTETTPNSTDPDKPLKLFYFAFFWEYSREDFPKCLKNVSFVIIK